jgi:Protein of unknown function (DUF1552)
LSSVPGALSPTLGAAFDPFRRKMALIRGLDLMGWTDGHNERVVLSGGSSGLSDPSSFGWSLDCVLEDSPKFYESAPMLGALRCAPKGRSWVSLSSKFSHGQVLPSESLASTVYGKLFDPTQVAQGAARNARVARMTSRVLEDYRQTFADRRISALDRARIENYMDIMSDLEGKVGNIPAISCGAVPSSFDRDTVDGAMDAAALHDGFFDLEVAALTCGITRIVTHVITHQETDPTRIGGPDFHAAAHNHGIVVGGGRTFKDYNAWTLARVARLLSKLEAVIDSDGNTLLDNTLVLFSSSDASGSHSRIDMPVLLAGAKDLLATDLYLDFRRETQVAGRSVVLGRPYNNLLVSMARILGLSPSDYASVSHGALGGFGEYSDGVRAYPDHYAPFVTAAARNEVIPELLT